MDNFIIIDTDLLIDVGRKVREAVDRIDKEEKTSVLGINIVTQMELIVGCRNKKELNALNPTTSFSKFITICCILN